MIKEDGPLTEAEIGVARLIQKGYKYKKIARELNISPHTVKNHVMSIRNKIGLGKMTKVMLIFILDLIIGKE